MREAGRPGRRDGHTGGRFAWAVLAVFVAVGAWPLLAPSPVPAGAPAERFSAERAMRHVRVIARAPHPVGTEALAQVRAYLVAELEALGLEVVLQHRTVPNAYGRGEPVSIVNVLARLPGTASRRSVALVAHYDTVPATPGGNDNTAAVAALIETARALRAGPALMNDIRFVFTDAEEPWPRHGARAIVGDTATLDDLGLVVNFEASGGAGASVLAETSGPERWLVQELAAAGGPPSAFSFFPGMARRMGDIGTDFDVFRNAGIPGLHFAYVHGSPIYHTASDDVDAVGQGSLQHHGDQALSIARHFGGLDLSVARGEERAVYFRAGPFFVHHSTTWALPLAVLTALLYVLATWRRRGVSGASPRRPVVAVLRTMGGGLLGTILGGLAWFALASLRRRPGVFEGYVYLGALLAAAAWIAWRTAGRPEAGSRRGVLGAFVLLALLTAAALPSWSYLFTWPALAASLVLLASRGRGTWVGYAVVAATTAIVMTPALDVFFQFAQPRPGNPDSQMPSAIALPLVLGLLSLGLLRTVRPRASSDVQGPASDGGPS